MTGNSEKSYIRRDGLITGEHAPRIALSTAWGDRIQVCTTAHDCTGDTGSQTTQVLNDIQGFLKKWGSDFSHLISARIWLKDIEELSQFRKVWNSWVNPENAPTVAIRQAAMAHEDIRIEIRVDALREKSNENQN